MAESIMRGNVLSYKKSSHRVGESGFRIRENPEFWALEHKIQLKESGIPLTIGIQNPSSTEKD